jgi:hypothetical protein
MDHEHQITTRAPELKLEEDHEPQLRSATGNPPPLSPKTFAASQAPVALDELDRKSQKKSLGTKEREAVDSVPITLNELTQDLNQREIQQTNPSQPSLPPQPSLPSPPSLPSTEAGIIDEDGDIVNQAFDAVDTDGSGYLEIGELKALMDFMGLDNAATPEMARKMLDTDGDGKISREEFTAFCRQHADMPGSLVQQQKEREARKKLAKLRWKKVAQRCVV